MAAPLMSERDLEFMLYELFDAESLTQRERYADHSRETFTAAMNTAKTVAEKVFLPFRQKADNEQPTFDGEKVHMIPEIKQGIDAVIEAGLASSTADYELGGMQLPGIVASAASSFLTAAGGVALGYTGLTNANANLIEAHGTAEQIQQWVVPMREGRFAGTMAMTEPGAGSGLADLTTTAEKDADGNYRISGSKIFISGGDHELNDNIVHLVLARVKGAPKGVKGISLFIVPKFLVNEDGSLGPRNDVALAGLFHKMGGRAQTSTALSFGEKDGAIGYLVGEENKGLSYMFHMMNEARIMVGTGAAVIANAGYQYSLDYAKERPQGRLLSEKDPQSPAVNIIQHPDVRRMLLTQKAYAEGAYALCLLGSQLADDEKTAETEEERKAAHTLLDFLTPIIKSWPSEFGPKANYHAIQVLGGHGYINEHPVEMFYRDNRLNPIHEGTTGIQSLDLLGRKVPMNNFAGYTACLAEMQNTIEIAKKSDALAGYAEQLAVAIATLKDTTKTVLGATQSMNIDAAFSNSVKYLDMFGHVVIAWLWLKQGIVANNALARQPHEADEHFYRGKLQALQYFFRIELPEINHWAKVISDLDTTSYDMQEEWF
ncbi:acyl-CoA dehydrogenase [Pseudomaricurvus alkylphenolicus]|jgi:butyryl-CoA dehydrogenase|uniref:acyl-CoA dehydrogenase n=1 Tax=Pseudomaricurvus alkylphenolicus TaxID=1306991 RepID=UPI001421C85A|nr:acyl-CoA dehydrogenase [Pseudomaricurvus alkylphenolicus]NIB41405.1 acyl-CoA dehydrogenase [Pseudomaricurvus alkylphenolicus]